MSLWKSLRKMQFLDGTALKIIAMVSMVIDHVGDSFFPQQIWIRAVGRIAMPIFAFCVAEGFIHTHDRGRYLLRMLIFGLISEIPFDLVTSGKILEFGHQNIMLTFSWAILGLTCCDKIIGKERSPGRNLAAAAILVVFLAVSVFLRLDYSMLALALIAVFYLLRVKNLWIRNTVAAAVHAAIRNVGIHWFGLLGFVPLYMYNGKRGKGLKWVFYLFYPCHFLVIFLIKRKVMA